MGGFLTVLWGIFSAAFGFYVLFRIYNHAKGHFKTKGKKLGYVIEGKNTFTGVSLCPVEYEGIRFTKDSDYRLLYFYQLSEVLKDFNTNMGLFTNIIDELNLDEVVSYEKGTYDKNWWTYKLTLRDGSTCTIRADKNEEITMIFERVLYLLTNK